ncbi:hypothetical protein [Paraburkholderia dipogonis]|uniref:hypothetical protein n=1 Tax=Paraburkholderia dipogonis TaxID=1211383 RepID=UPI0038BA798A
MRTSSDTDFNVDVEGIGRFVFARRTIADGPKIRSRYNVLTEGNYSPEGFMWDTFALALVTLQTLMVSSPDTFNIDALDPLMDDDCEKTVVKIVTALYAKEGSFRRKQTQGSEVAGAGASA